MPKSKANKNNTNLITVNDCLTTDQFLILYSEEFPNLESEIYDEGCRDLIYVQIGLLSNYINECIKEGAIKEVRRAFIFFERIVNRVNSEVENAFYVSFLEHIKMGGDSENAVASRKLLNPKYLEIWRGLNELMFPDKIAGTKKKKSPDKSTRIKIKR
ncbi:DUF7674 family protein [Mucilaginibacter gilvus]|uniref:DUF7674 domain-containing protein n=1 Tax=Mucilaginibacter gilvus TaxID=2305909 RepID=A0A444MM30_9SPHI|nr:hypothetical protein [Mucilaginibacter gilvus]RWY50303.1 hypothetical protein EPL05_16280 [Mucilaginibacter gilvus]